MGVKSFGCENRTAQLSPFQSWKSMGPSVVSAWKSGASSPNRSAMDVFLLRSLAPVLRRPWMSCRFILGSSLKSRQEKSGFVRSDASGAGRGNERVVADSKNAERALGGRALSGDRRRGGIVEVFWPRRRGRRPGGIQVGEPGSERLGGLLGGGL